MKKVNRIPSENIYNFFLTLVMAFAIITAIYALTPNKHCSMYFTKKI